MFQSDMDGDDREAAITVGGGILLLLGLLVGFHLLGFRFAGGVSGNFSL